MKGIKKIIKNGFLVIAASAITVSCSEDFLDVNENPNDPSVSTPGLTLPVAQETFASLNATDMVEVGQYFMYNWAVPSNWSANSDLLRYNVTSSFYTSIFEVSYASIFKNLTYVENYTDASGAVDYTAYDAIAETVKGFQYQYLVDLYGDVPFYEANLRGENTTPAYDDAETVYKAVIDSLTTAATKALDLPENAENPGDHDIIFGGDMNKWAQFANTIKLRMLIRLSNTGQDSYIQDQIDAIQANGAGFITSNVTANPGYSKNENQQNPFWAYTGFETSGTETDEHDINVATDYVINYLEQKNDTLRLERLYAEAKNGGYKGVQQSIDLPGEGFTSDDLSAVGPGLLKSADQDQPIMLLSEALFLQAEAVQRGYLDGGEDMAKDLYQQGIEASFKYLEVEDAAQAAEDYYTQSLENVSWDASPNKIEAIITQKWIALNGTSSIESWMEWVRTGYPSGLPTSTDSDGVRPVRLLYPTSEYSTNSDNVPATSTDDAFNNPPFWK
ncbi:MAG: SusD/RagB family nutrient-binding outer membrane lipoprotein [Salegentibacter sp.]